LAEGLDIIVGAGVLAAELVARETEDGEVFRVLRLEFLVELLEAFELGSEAALGCSVDDQDSFALERGEGEGLSFLCLGGCRLETVSHFCTRVDHEGIKYVLSTGLKS
jgi:hypothetical protein